MEVTLVDLDKFVCTGDKPDNFDLLEASLLEFGFVEPIIITSRMEMINGAHRLATLIHSPALRVRFNNKVPCIVHNVSIAEKDAMIEICINKCKGE
jgi:ParB-like chromosome segregation protein Spo0J